MEFITLVKGNKNQVFITTHSPYILGTINNLLYADRICSQVNRIELNKIINKNAWLPFSTISAFYINKGRVEACTDEEFGSIENEVIDGASEEINSDFEKMVLLKKAQ